jgi:predicted NUDIX family NTP pyrophosphohydrolase
MGKKSAGILLFRFHNDIPEVLLVHPGDPVWSKKDEGAWSIPEGELAEDENPREAAIREVKDELGVLVFGNFIALTPLQQKNDRLMYCWAVRHNIDPEKISSNTFELEWPPKSGKKITIPEVDKAAWFTMEGAKKKIQEEQVGFIEELHRILE